MRSAAHVALAWIPTRRARRPSLRKEIEIDAAGHHPTHKNPNLPRYGFSSVPYLGIAFFRGFGLFPICRRELSNFGDLGRGQAREQVLEVIERVDPMPTAAAQKREN